MNLYQLHSKPESLDLHDQAHKLVPELVWERYKDQPEELKKRETVLAKNAMTAYNYAFSVLGGPFKLGEAAIAKNAGYAYMYAHHVKGRFELGESAIVKDLAFTYMYARDVLKGPFKLGEAAIAKDAEYAYLYALNVLKLPEPEAKSWGKDQR